MRDASLDSFHTIFRTCHPVDLTNFDSADIQRLMARRELKLRPDYTGQTIEDRYMVGYGMDSEEIGRNYSEIFYFKQ